MFPMVGLSDYLAPKMSSRATSTRSLSENGCVYPLEQCVRGSRRDVRRWECVERSKSASVTVSLRGAICSASLCPNSLAASFQS